MLHRLVYERDDEYYAQWTQSFTNSLGVFCSGGTVANITALWAARNQLLSPKGSFGGVAEDGVFAGLKAHGYDDLAVLVSRRGHYSMRKAMDLLGLGRKNLISIPVAGSHKVDVAAMRAKLEELKKKKTGVMAIVGIAGTTETGNVDPLDGLADLAEEFGVSFHVDAAWGGPALFSERYKHLLKGIERADSVTIDAHKQLYVPIGAGMVVFKDVQALTAVEHHANYVIRKGSRDIGKHTLEGTRPGMAMLVHSALRIIGRRGYELLIDHGIGKAGQFAKMIHNGPEFELVTEPELNLLTYRYVPPAVKTAFPGMSNAERAQINDDLNELTEEIQKEQRARGKTFVSRTRLETKSHDDHVLTVFRVVLANPLTTRQILAEILEEQKAYGDRLVQTDERFKSLLALTRKL